MRERHVIKTVGGSKDHVIGAEAWDHVAFEIETGMIPATDAMVLLSEGKKDINVFLIKKMVDYRLK